MRSLFLILVLSLSFPARANTGAIVHATRKLRMSYTEAQAPKDFYVNIGAREGLRAGDRLQVTRNFAIPDSQSDGSVRVVPVVLGTLLVVALGENACITREDVLSPPAALPAMQYTGFMVGDEVSYKTGLPTGSGIP